MNKHTGGPWRIGDAGITVFGPKTERPAPEIVATSIKKRANAKLIAAAPELLAALEALLRSYAADFKNITGSELNETVAVRQAKDAIAKAADRRVGGA